MNKFILIFEHILIYLYYVYVVLILYESYTRGIKMSDLFKHLFPSSLAPYENHHLRHHDDDNYHEHHEHDHSYYH